MHLSFTPSLGDVLDVSSLPARTTAALNFTVTMDSASYTELKRDGVRVQVWTDIPIDGQDPSNADWAALDFQDQELTKLGLATNSLENLLSAQIGVPLARQTTFSFTYRLVYPAGEIRWLGQFGQNGTVVVDQSPASHHLVLGDGWSANGDAQYLWDTGGHLGEGLDIAKLSILSEYAVWAIGGQTWISFVGTAHDSSLVFLVPRTDPRSVLLSPTYVFSASPGARITVSSLGVITACGAGSLLLQIFDARTNLRASVDSIMANGSSDICRVLALDTNTRHILLATLNDRHPIRAVAIPLGPRQIADSHVQVRLSDFAALLPNDTHHFSAFSPLNRSIHYFTRRPSRDQEISLTLDPWGEELVFSPVYNLNNDVDEQWQVSILSDYDSIRLLENPEAGNLPTPPPSPHLRPVAHLSSSRISSGTSDHSIPNVFDVGIAEHPSREATPESSPALTARSQLPAARAASLVYTRLLFSMATSFLMALYNALLGRLKGGNSRYTDRDRTQVLDRREDSDRDAVTEMPPSPASGPVDCAPKIASSASVEVTVSGGIILIALRSSDVAKSVTRIAVTLNGEDPGIPFTKLDDDGVSLLEFDGGNGGVVRISYT